jgi:hypothetical protein
MGYSKQKLEDFYTEHAWNEGRLRRSLANKQELTLISDFVKDVEAEGLWFEASFEQTHETAYGFEVHVCVELVPEMDKFIAWLFIDGKRKPLHKPVEIPIKYGFTAQANQILTACMGLMYVYQVAGVECLDYYPDGMKKWK